MRWRPLLKAIGPVVGLLILIYLLSRVDFARLGDTWKRIRFGLLALGMAAVPASLLVRALRWRYLLLATRRVPLRKLYSALAVGMAANWILPFRIGEMAGALALSRLEPIRFTTLAASVVADRILDVLWLAAALVLALKLFPLHLIVIPAGLFGVELRIGRANLVDAANLLAVVFLGVVVFLVVLYFRQRTMVRLVNLTVGRVSPGTARWLNRGLTGFADGLHILRHASHLAMALLTTLLLWGVMLAGVYVLIASFPFATPPSLLQAFLVLICIATGLTAPSAPGYVGSFHLAIVMGLVMADPQTDLNLAIGFAILYHLSQFVPIVLLGLLFMWIDGLSLTPRRWTAHDRGATESGRGK